MPTFEAERGGLLWDATAVPNAFFCEYMPAAPDSHVKVYLYGLMCAHGGVQEEGDLLDDVARSLALSRDEVECAMRYWERCRLVERVKDTPPVYRFLSVQQAMLKRREAPRDEAYEAFAQAVYAAFGDRRKLHGGETVLAYEWVEQLKLPAEVVLMLIQHMIATRGVNFSFKAAQKLAAGAGAGAYLHHRGGRGGVPAVRGGHEGRAPGAQPPGHAPQPLHGRGGPVSEMDGAVGL